MVMLQLLDESLEAFLRAAVPLVQSEVDVAFDAPDKDWAARVSRPTVNLYLWEVRRNAGEQDAGRERVDGENGRSVWRPPLPIVDCRYLVTAWTSEVRDEHALLGAVLQSLLRTRVLPQEHLAPELVAKSPSPAISVATPDDRETSDFWSALGGQLKPGLDLLVTAPVVAVPTWPVAEVVRRRHVTVVSRSHSPFGGGRDDLVWDGPGDSAADEQEGTPR
jgi:hypothetical protein